MFKRIFIILTLCSHYSIVSYAQEPEFNPPVADKRVHTTIIHGDTLSDNYYWLKEKNNPDVINYLYAENAYADNMMKHTKILQKKLYEELRGNYKESYSSLPYKEDNYYYYTRFEKGKEYAYYCRKKDSLTNPEEIYFDANETAKDFMFFNLGIFSVSPNHQLLAYGVDTKGDRVQQIFFKDLVSGKMLTDSLPKTLQLIWANDNKSFFYVTPEHKTIRANKVYRHVLGRHSSLDELVFEEPDKTFQIDLKRSDSEDYIFLTTNKTKVDECWYLNANNSQDKFKLIQKREANLKYSVEHYEGEDFFISTNWNALNYRIVKTAINSPSKENWIEIIPHREHVLLNGYRLFKDFLVLSEKENAINQIRIINRKNNKSKRISFIEELYNSSISSDYEYEDNKIRFNYSSMLTVPEVYDYDLKSDSITLIKRDSLLRSYNKSDYISERIYARAADGSEIPISLVYKKGIQLNGNNPLFLTSYGSYGAPNDISFSAARLSYLDRGFIYAEAHIRGSNDLGMNWYENGKMLNKKNTFTDFIACAEHLIERNYTNKEKLAIEGVSAGGLLMGAVTNMRPDLFKCVVANVPFVDVINTMLDSTLPLTTFEYDEWGNPHIRSYYEYMKSYSPYDNVSKKAYPLMLVTAGYNDSQVGYWEPAKWVAKLRESKTDTNSILFQTSMDGGHGRSTGRYNGYKLYANEMAFIMHCLGIKENYVPISGKVLDSSGEPMPYVNVYVNGTTNGTTSNGSGDFYIELKAGQKSEIVFQTVGFKKHIEKIDIKTPTSDMKVVLHSENIELPQFTLSAKAKDPAYGVIKNAINKRKYYYELANSYSADVYIKGNSRINQIPDKLPKFLRDQLPDTNDLGLLYLSESVARFHFQLPENFKEEMLSSKVAGANRGFSWNRVEDVLFNFYKNSISLGYISEREFISPISETALLFYKYKLEGTFYEEGKLVNKIAVIPRNVADPIFHGYIYIFEDTWNIHSLDLFATKDAQLEFVDTLGISQTFAPVNDSLSMPITLKINTQFSMWGFSAGDSYIGFFSNYQVNKVFPKKFFNSEVFRIDAGANKKDTIYWSNSRPILLTEEEEKHYTKKDSLLTKQNSKEYLDSLDSKGNKLTAQKILLSGYTHYSRFHNRTMHINSVVRFIDYNTIEGPVANFSGWIYKYNDSTGFYQFKPDLRYGYESKAFYSKVKFVRQLNFQNYARYELEGGRFVNQFNGQNPIDPLINAAYTLLAEQNYLKLYERSYIKGNFGRELINGLFFKAGLEYNHRKALLNHQTFSVYDFRKYSLTSNDPLNPFTEKYSFESHNALILDLSLRIRFNQKYESHPYQKRLLGSKYPTVYLNYTKGIKAMYSDVNYDRLEIGIGKSINLGYLGSGDFDAIAGNFLNSKQMSFIDYKHFNGNQTHFLKNSSDWNMFDQGRTQLANFNNLPYYSYSTNTSYLELHYEHRFQGLFLGKFPLIKKLGMGEVAGMNAIYTSNNRDYQEVYVGVENIAKFLRVDFVASYKAGEKIEPQLRIGLTGGI